MIGKNKIVDNFPSNIMQGTTAHCNFQPTFHKRMATTTKEYTPKSSKISSENIWNTRNSSNTFQIVYSRQQTIWGTYRTRYSTEKSWDLLRIRFIISVIFNHKHTSHSSQETATDRQIPQKLVSTNWTVIFWPTVIVKQRGNRKNKRKAKTCKYAKATRIQPKIYPRRVNHMNSKKAQKAHQKSDKATTILYINSEDIC